MKRLLSVPVLVFLLGISAFAGSCVLGSGCSKSDDPKRVVPPPVVQDRSSPEAVLLSLRDAYLNREAADYESLLAVDFQFYFSEEDQQIAEKLVREQEVTVHQNMFGSQLVNNIALGFTPGDLILDEGKSDPRQPGQFLWTILMTNVDLQLRTRDNQGQTMTYRVEDAIEQFWFRQEERVEPGSGNAIWTIVEWKELTQLNPGDQSAGSRAASSEATSWGQIKSMFRSK
jgi:hypothetical protein